jgi:hypothetical protein
MRNMTGAYGPLALTGLKLQGAKRGASPPTPPVGLRLPTSNLLERQHSPCASSMNNRVSLGASARLVTLVAERDATHNTPARVGHSRPGLAAEFVTVPFLARWVEWCLDPQEIGGRSN